MRVTIVSKACVVGAYQKKLEEIARHEEIDLTVVVPPYWRDNGRRQSLERTHTRGYHLVVAPLVFNGRFHTHFYPTLPAILRKARPDLVHIDEEPYNLATYLAARQAARLGAEVLFFTWQNLLRHYPFPFGHMERHVYRRARGALAGSRSAGEVLRAKGYHGPIRVLPQFGVDPQIFRPRARRAAHQPFAISYAGRLVPEKGLDVLVEAVAGLPGEWRTHFYGDGPMRDELHCLVQRLNLSDRVVFHDHVSSTQMSEKLGGADALVLPSRTWANWKEQFGRVLIEAMACGVPVVGSDSGEIPEVIGDAGIVVPEGDAGALREALRALREDPDLWTALSQRGRERVLARYTQSRIADETVAYYHELLSC